MLYFAFFAKVASAIGAAAVDRGDAASLVKARRHSFSGSPSTGINFGPAFSNMPRASTDDMNARKRRTGRHMSTDDLAKLLRELSVRDGNTEEKSSLAVKSSAKDDQSETTEGLSAPAPPPPPTDSFLAQPQLFEGLPHQCRVVAKRRVKIACQEHQG